MAVSDVCSRGGKGYLKHDAEGRAQREGHFAQDEAAEEEAHKRSHCNLRANSLQELMLWTAGCHLYLSTMTLVYSEQR